MPSGNNHKIHLEYRTSNPRISLYQYLHYHCFYLLEPWREINFQKCQYGQSSRKCLVLNLSAHLRAPQEV